MDKKVLLMILDGWGEGKHDRSNAIYTQGTPNLDKLRAKYHVSFLKACGEDVGLPEGQMGNSEVGHLNIGAGRIVYQDLVKINRACAQHKLLENKEIKAAYDYVAGSGKALHFFGLCSHGGVHSSLTAESTAPWPISTSFSKWPHSTDFPRCMYTVSWTAVTATPAAARAS